MRIFLLTLSLALLTGSTVSATLTEEQQGRLLEALTAMGAAPLEAQSGELCDYVMRDTLDLASHRALFDQFFSGQAFTQHHAYNLEAHLHYSTADKEKMARFAGAFAASALLHAWQRAESSGITPLVSLPFLESLFNKGVENITAALATGIEDVLGEQVLNLAPFLTLKTPYARGTVLEAMQTCITLGAFSEKEGMTSWIKTPETTDDFFKRTKVWLFDGGALQPPQLASLESLFSTLPATLHGIIILHVPEITGFSAEDPSLLRVPGLSLDIPQISMERMRNLSLYPPGARMTPIPEFTAVILERLAAAIQTHQFNQRPDLHGRIQYFFSLLTSRPDPVFASLFPPNLAYGTPEERMAYLVFYWLANSQLLLEPALNQAEQQIRAPLFSLLLAADLFSESGDTTLLFKTSPTGILFSEKTALRRVGLAPGITYVNGIAVSEQLWHYEMGDMVRTIPAP